MSAGPWQEVPAGTELVGPSLSIARRGVVDYTPTDTTARLGELGVSPPDRSLFGVEVYDLPAEPGHGSYGFVEGEATRPVPVDPDQLPGITRPATAVGYEWEGPGTVTAFEFTTTTDPGNTGVWDLSRTASGFIETLSSPPLSAVLRRAVLDPATFTLAPHPSIPGLFTGTAPYPGAGWTPLDSLSLGGFGPGEFEAEEVFGDYPGPFRVPFADGEFVAIGVRLSWSDGGGGDIDPRLRAEVASSWYRTFDVMTGFPRYRWLYPDVAAGLYGWGLILADAS